MDLLTYGFSGAVALLLIAGSLPRLTRRPAASRPATTAWANLLLGVALALFPLSRLPHGHRLLWDDLLFPPGMVCLLAAAYLHWRGLRGSRS